MLSAHRCRRRPPHALRSPSPARAFLSFLLHSLSSPLHLRLLAVRDRATSLHLRWPSYPHGRILPRRPRLPLRQRTPLLPYLLAGFTNRGREIQVWARLRLSMPPDGVVRSVRLMCLDPELTVSPHEHLKMHDISSCTECSHEILSLLVANHKWVCILLTNIAACPYNHEDVEALLPGISATQVKPVLGSLIHLHKGCRTCRSLVRWQLEYKDQTCS